MQGVRLCFPILCTACVYIMYFFIFIYSDVLTFFRQWEHTTLVHVPTLEIDNSYVLCAAHLFKQLLVAWSFITTLYMINMNRATIF